MLILPANGALAQLGERLHGMQEVVGSNPIGSIVQKCSEVLVGEGVTDVFILAASFSLRFHAIIL